MSSRVSLIATLFAIACGGSAPAPSPPPPSPPAPTPEPTPGPEPAPEPGSSSCEGPAPGPGYECVRDCGGPVVQDGDPPPGYSWLSAEDAEKRKQFGCPICLPFDARIATPSGSIPVSQLRPGTLVWSADDGGRRVTTHVIRVLSTPVPVGHTLAVVELADGRVVRASPGHPTPSGRALGSFSVGDSLDGSTVIRVRHVAYSGRTWDLVLDEGRTRYVSDGVIVESSLAR